MSGDFTGYTIKSPTCGLLSAFVRQNEDQPLIEFTIGLHAVTLERSLTKAEIVEMARSRWKEMYEPNGYSVVKVRLAEEPT
jgi:hypothetical protein